MNLLTHELLLEIWPRMQLPLIGRSFELQTDKILFVLVDNLLT